MTSSNGVSAAALTFDDEFNNLSLWNESTGTWSTEFIFADPNGNGSSLPGNGEQEWYINNNYAPTASVTPWTVSNGVLTLTAAPVTAAVAPYLGYSQPGLPAMGSYQYTSGLLETSHSFSQTYGYFEMRAELPAGQGAWPAFWLLPQNGSWPPELDIMEVLGNSPNTLYTTVHSNETGVETNSGIGTTVANTAAGYNTYAVDWEADHITWYFDGKAVYQVATPADMHQPMYMLVNLAMGGYWPGNADSSTPLPANMNVDYVRAYSSMPTGGEVSAAQAATLGNAGPANAVTVADTAANVASDLDALQAPAAAGGLAWITLTDAATPTVTVSAAQLTADAAAIGDIVSNHTLNVAGVTVAEAAAIQANINANTFTITDSAADVSAALATLAGDAKLTAITLTDAATPTLSLTQAEATADAGVLALITGHYNLSVDGAAITAPVTPVVANTQTLVAGFTADILTGTAAADTFSFPDLPWNAGQVTNFRPGTDKLDLTALFTAANYHGANPIADGTLSFSSDGAGNTEVTFNAHSASNPWPILITTLDHVTPSAVSLSDVLWGGTASSGTSSTATTTVAAPPAAETLTANDSAGQVLTGNGGNDTFYAGHNSAVMTGGAGADSFVFQNLPWNAGQITDFTPGTDKLDVSALFTAIGYHGANPVTDGTLSFIADGAGDTEVYFNSQSTSNPWPTLVVTLDHVASNSVSLSDVIWGGASTPTASAASTATETLTANDTAGQVLTGNPGTDTFYAGHNSVVMTGGAGMDTFVFQDTPWNAGHITNFVPGTDKLDLSALFSAAGYQGTDPVADGTLSFTSDGAGDTQVSFNSHQASDPWPSLLTTLDHVAPGAVSLSDVLWGGSVDTSTAAGSTTTTTAATVAPTAETLTADNSAGQILTGGAGSDIFYAGQNSVVMTGGAGADTFVFQALPWNAGHITDFMPGTDKLDLTGLFTAANYHGTNPVADGYLSFVADTAGDTEIYFHAQGAGTAIPILVTTLDHVQPTGLSAHDWLF